jgi:hypothetical protein
MVDASIFWQQTKTQYVCQKPKKILGTHLHKYMLFHNSAEYYGWGLVGYNTAQLCLLL